MHHWWHILLDSFTRRHQQRMNELLKIVESGVLANMGYSGDNGWLDGAVLELLGIPARADCSDCILDDKSRPWLTGTVSSSDTGSDAMCDVEHFRVDERQRVIVQISVWRWRWNRDVRSNKISKIADNILLVLYYVLSLEVNTKSLNKTMHHGQTVTSRFNTHVGTRVGCSIQPQRYTWW